MYTVTPLLGGLYVLLLFLLSFVSVLSIKYVGAYFRKNGKDSPAQAPQKHTPPVYFILKKQPKRRKTAKKNKQTSKPKQELYYLSTLQKQEESE